MRKKDFPAVENSHRHKPGKCGTCREDRRGKGNCIKGSEKYRSK
jgi:hypothetical protein